MSPTTIFKAFNPAEAQLVEVVHEAEPILVADGKLFVMNEKCDLTLVKASSDKFEPLATAKILQGHDAWAPLALAGDRLLVRDSKVLVCLNVGKGIE